MNITILQNEQEVAERGADIVSHQLALKPASVLGLPTGVTPLQMYRSLVQRCQAKDVSFANAKTFMLDEYVGMDRNASQSYSHYMQTRFFNRIDINQSKTHALYFARQSDFQAISADYEDRIQNSGGIDLQILGLGVDGELGFNEPGSSFASRTRVVQLSERGLKQVPRAHREIGLAATMGLRTIRESRHVLLMATGSHKAKAVRAALEGPMNTDCPASCLQFHNNLTVLLDEAAAKELTYKALHEIQYQWRLRNLATLDSSNATTESRPAESQVKAVYPLANAA